MNNKKTNILERANDIINKRSEEKEREYGPMSEGFERAAMIASGMSGKEWNAHDMFIAMAALKLSRQSYNFKEDNLLDLVSYLGAWQNYIDEKGDKNNRKNSSITGDQSKEGEEIENYSSSLDNDQLQLDFFDVDNLDIANVVQQPAGVTAISPLSGETYSGNSDVDRALESLSFQNKRRAR